MTICHKLWHFYKVICIVAIVCVFTSCGEAKSLHDSLTIQWFDNAVEAHDTIKMLMMSPREFAQDTNRIKYYRIRLSGDQDTNISNYNSDCHIFGNNSVKCGGYQEEYGENVYYTAPPFEAVPAWAHSFLDRDRGIGDEDTGTVGFVPSWHHNRDALLDRPVDSTRSWRLLPELSITDGMAYGLDMGLVGIDQISSGEHEWKELLDSAHGRPIDCWNDLSLCVVVVHLDYPGMGKNEKIYGACRSFLSGSGNNISMTSPFGCRIIGYEKDNARYMLTIRAISLVDTARGGGEGVVTVAGIRTERQLRELLARSLSSMGLDIEGGPNGPTGPMVLTSSGSPGVFDASFNRYIWKQITATYIGPMNNHLKDSWDVFLAIWVHGSIRDDQSHRELLESLVPGVKKDFITAIRRTMIQECQDVKDNSPADGIGFTCTTGTIPSQP
jgi:hypothetical protein